MATLTRKFYNSTPQGRFTTLALMPLVLAGAGCATAIKAGKLPRWAAAPVTTNIQETGLRNLIPPPFNSQMIDRGDVLEVTIVTDFGNMKSLTTPIRVERDGMANIPLIGRVGLAGFELDEAGPVVAAAGIDRGVFRRPHVTVTMKRKRVNHITVMGAVKEPSVIELPCSGSSVLAAIISAGGLAEDAGDEVVIRRPLPPGAVPQPLGPPQQRVADGTSAELTSYQPGAPTATPQVAITRINLATATAEGHNGYLLGDGDVVMVSKRVPKPIYVMGLVRNPGEYELPPNQDLFMLDVLAKAGDRTMEVADRVLIIRRVPDRPEPVVIQASISEAKKNGAANERLAPGDIVSVEETPATIVVRTMRDVIRVTVGGTAGLF